MIEFKESKFYKLLQDFFINNNKETFLQMLSEFYNRTESIIEKDEHQDEIIKELRELYLELNEKGIDENIVIEKVNYFVENNVKIKDIIVKLITNTNNIEKIRKFNLANHNLFDENDIGVAFNKIMETVKDGDYIYLEYDKEVKCVTPMQVPSWLNDVQFDFKVPIHFKGNGTMFTTGTGCQRCQFNFTKIRGLNSNNNGLEFNCLHHSNIRCITFEDFNQCIIVNGGVNAGSQYNKFDCQFIKGTTCIVLNAKDKNGWVSENIFTGRVLGAQGIVFLPVNDVTEDWKFLKYENNKFLNMGFEGLTMSAAQLNNASGTVFENFRLFKEENTSITSKTFFFENASTCVNSIYSTSCLQEGDYYAGVASNGTRIIATFREGYSEGIILDGKKYWREKYKNKTECLKGGTKTIDLTTSTTSYTLEKLFDCLFIQTKGNRTIVIPKYMLEDGNSFTIDLQFVSGSINGDDVVFRQDTIDGKVLCTIPQTQGNGTYKLMFWKNDGVYHDRLRWKRENQTLFV